MRTRLILNPTSNQGKAAQVLPFLHSQIHSLPHTDLFLTEYHGHAIDLAARSAEDGIERLVSLGGDGTAHEIVNGLMKLPDRKKPELAIIPLGSGNDFSFANGLQGSLTDLFHLAMTGHGHLVDIAVMTDNLGKSEYWINSLGIGFDALINIYSRSVHLFKGFWVYLLAALRTILFNFTSFRFTATMDGNTWQSNLLMLTLLNGTREGGSFQMAPRGKVDDSVLNYSAVNLISRPQMLRALVAYMNGTQDRLSYIQSGTFKSLELNADRPLILHSDGEILAGLDSQVTRLSIQCVPQAIRLVRD